MADTVRWDDWSPMVEEAIRAQTSEKAEETFRMVIVCLAHPWSPTALLMAQHFEHIRKKGNLPSVHILIVNADNASGACFDVGVTVTPATLFYVKGKPITIRRPDWDDDCKLMGSMSRAKLEDFVQYAATSTVECLIFNDE